MLTSLEKLLSVEYGTPREAACERFSVEKPGPVMMKK
jgi:hypothetical protein